MNMKNYRSKATVRILLNLLSDPAAIVDGKGNFLTVNDAFEEVTGQRRKELVGTPILRLNIVTPETKSVLLENLKNRLQGAHVESYEVCFRGKLGDTRWVEVTGKRVRYSGKPASLVVFHDFTGRKKKAEETLRKSEEEYISLFANMMDGFAYCQMIFDERGKSVDFVYLQINDAFEKITGLKRDLVVGKKVTEAIPGIKEANPELFEIYGRVALTGQRERFEVFFKPLSMWLSISVYRPRRGYFAAVFEDITERKKAEETLRESEEKHRKLFEESMDAIFVADTATGTIVECNSAASKLVGRQKSELVGQHQSIIHPKEQTEEGFTGGFKQHLKDQTATLETQIIRKTGEIRDVAVRDTIFELKGKKLMQGTFRDITERKLMQHALQESEEKFRTITNSVKDAIILIDDEAKVVYWNPAAEKTFGYSNVEANGKEVHELIVPKTMSLEGRKYIRIGLQQFADTGSGAFTNGNVELLGRRKDGTEFPVKLSITPIKLQGKWSAVGVVKDITERKQAEQKLQEAEKRFHSLFNQAPLGVLVIDPQTAKPVEFNDITHTQLGYSREEFSKLCISDFEAKEKPEEINAHLAKMVKGGGDEFETKHRTKNGEFRNVLVNIRVVELAGKPFLYCIFHDITEIRKVQDALMKSETQYRQLVNVAQEGIWALDSDCRTVFVNPQIAKMLGYAESEMVGKNLVEFLDKKCIKQAKQFLGRFKQVAKGHFDCELGHKDGSRIYVSIVVSVINDDEGKPSGTLMMVSDITDRKVLESRLDNYSKHLKSMVELRTVQLKDANERLVKSERLAVIGELAGMVGHDLRNPLTGIKNAAYYLKKKGTTISEAQAKEMLEIIDKSIGHSNKIINDLLDYSREMHLGLTKYAAHTLVDEATRMIQIPDRIQIVNYVPEETLIRVDADKMMRVFINLIKNAIDAMPEKGTLEITSRKTRDNVEIAFADTGTGIPKETLQKIFTPLFTTKAQGMGFGLAICKRIIESHEGTITVKTAVNRGTTFTISLPVKPIVEVGGEKTWINMPESLLSTTTKT
jgi:PAS domain S-box-containing protein